MKLRAGIFAALMAFPATGVLADDNPVVVELFTSQGCSSCPPADALLQRLTERDDVIPLALHVDYWDYIGWTDEYADPAYTRRQRNYARFAGRKMVYTPQMIVNGQEDIVGAKSRELVEAIARHKAEPQRVDLDARRMPGSVTVRVQPVAAPLEGPLVVQLVQYDVLRKSHITEGENAGRDLEHANVVVSWTVLGEWDGQGPAELGGPLEGDQPAVVLVQQKGPSEIVAAARVE